MSNQQNEHIEKELSESIKRLEILKGNIYSLCESTVYKGLHRVGI